MPSDAPKNDAPFDASRPATRVDRAHARADDLRQEIAPAERKLAPVATVEATPSVTAGQVRLQASQLAAHLQRQQAALDHREGELNARVAAMENQIRAARLWIDERQSELAQREAEIAQREERQARAGGEVAESTAGKPSPRRAGGEVALDERAAELDRREAELAAAAERLGRRFGSTDETSGTSASLDSYRSNLERAEKLLADQQADWEKKFRELAEQRVAFTRHVEIERGKIAEERRQAGATVDIQLRELKRQEAELANRLAALETMRVDVTRTQQETLELRLATEELWSRLSGDHEPASLTQSLGQIRLRLAEEFHLAKADLAAERSEIKQLAEQVAEQHQKTANQRSETQAWLNARLRELEHYAGRLASRERQLDEQRSALQTEKAQWQGDRFRLEQEIRRLLRQGGALRSASAA